VLDKRAYRAALSGMRLERLARTADQLARIYIDGYECGLRGQDTSDWIWLEGTREMKRMFEIGNAAGLRRRAAARGTSRRVRPARGGKVDPADIVRRDDAK
jgi:hypothetical protein